MASKKSLKVGQKVIVDGKAGFTIEKLMNLSAKVVDKDGKSKIVPYSLISVGKADSKASSTKKDAPAKGKKGKAYIKDDEDPDDEDPEDDEPAEEDPDDDEPAETPVKKYKRNVGDDISEMLADAGTPTKMVDACKKHPAYKHINMDAFKRTAAQKNDLQSGLFKMRLSNLLRAAVRRAEKA